MAQAHSASPAEVALAWLLELSPNVVAIPGARRPEAVRSAVRAARLELDEADRRTLADAFGRSRASTRSAVGGEVVLVMGIPGAGKTRIAEEYAARDYARLNRDERGGTLRALAGELDRSLAAGERRIVLDNTYLTRARRSHVLDAAARHGVETRCVWLDTTLAQAQINLVERLLDRFGALPTPEELRTAARREPGLLLPTSQMRAQRELEPPTADEGWGEIEQRPFVRAAWPGTQPGVFVAAAALERDGFRGCVRAGRAPDRRRWCSTGTRAARVRRRSAGSPLRSQGRSKLRCALTAAARRPAGAARRCRACRSPSRAEQASIRRGRC